MNDFQIFVVPVLDSFCRGMLSGINANTNCKHQFGCHVRRDENAWDLVRRGEFLFNNFFVNEVYVGGKKT